MLREQLQIGLNVGLTSANWTNNNAESLNAVSKHTSGI